MQQVGSVWKGQELRMGLLARHRFLLDGPSFFTVKKTSLLNICAFFFQFRVPLSLIIMYSVKPFFKRLAICFKYILIWFVAFQFSDINSKRNPHMEKNHYMVQ